MTGPIDTAYVLIEPDLSQFESRTDAGVTAGLRGAESAVQRAIADMEVQFAELAARVGDDFGEIRLAAVTAFEELGTFANTASDEISTQFAEMGARVDTIFEEMQHQADRDMDQMAVHAEETGGRISGAFGKAAGLAKTGLLGIAAGLGTAAVFGLKSAATLEQVQISFESLTGSVAAGTKQFKDLQQFAAATPFEFKDLTTAAQRFDAFSAAIGQSKQQLIPFLTTIGNLVSETGGGAQALDSISLALGQTASQGKLTLGNLNQINNAIPGFSSVAALAAVRGETTAQVMKEISSGAIDAKTGINQLLVGMQKFPGAAGAMQKQSETLLGVFSTFSDTVSQALAGAFAPVIPLIKDSLTKITPIIGQALTVLGPALGKLISSVLPVLASLLQGIVPIIVPILDALTQAFAIIGPVLAPLGAALGLILKALEPLVPILANILVAAVNALIPVIVALAPVIGELAKPIGDILIALAPLIPPLGELLVAVVQLLEPFIKLLALISKWNTKLISAEVKVAVPLIQALADGVAWLAKWIDKIDWKAVGKAIVDFVKSVGSFFVGLWNDITGFFKAIPKWLGQVGSFFAGIWDKVVGFFEGLPDKIGNFLSSLPGKLQEAAVRAFDLFFQAVGYGIGLILKEFMALPGQVMSFVKTLWANVVNGFNKGVAFLESLPGRIWKLITGLWDGAVKLTSTGIANIIGFVVGLYHGIVNWFTKAWDTGKARFLKGVDDVVSFAKALPGRVVAWISQLPGKISTAVSGAGKWLYDAGKNIIMGLIHGIEDFVGSAIDTIKRAMGSVIKGAMSALGQHSPSKVFAEIGHNVVLGYIKGVEGGTGDAVAATSQMVSPRGQSFASPVIGPGGGMPVHVTVNFNGAVPTPAEAFTTGQAAGRGVASALATQAARNRVRTM